MKFWALLILFLPAAAFVQKEETYSKIMGRFVNFYNRQQIDSIITLYDPRYRLRAAREWTPEKISQMHKQYGKITNFKYTNRRADNEGLMWVETVFTIIGKNGTGLTVNDQNYITDLIIVLKPPTMQP